MNLLPESEENVMEKIRCRQGEKRRGAGTGTGAGAAASVGVLLYGLG